MILPRGSAKIDNPNPKTWFLQDDRQDEYFTVSDELVMAIDKNGL